MRNCGRVGTVAHRRCDRMVMLVFLVSAALAGGLFAVLTPGGDASSSYNYFSPMKADALFLMASSHHARRPPQSRAPRSGPSTAASPQPESNTKRRLRDSRSLSPLIVFYGMVLGRPAESQKDEQKSEASNGKTGDKFDDDFFNKDMIQRKKEFSQRYENFRGRGRWGGYSLVALQEKDSHPKRAPLPVVSATTPPPTKPFTSVAPTATKSMKQRQQRRQFKRPEPMLQVTNIQQYKDEVVDTKDSSLVVVRFYASWCKACKAIESSYYRLPQEFPSGVKFVEVPLTKENAYMHKGLGIPSLPFAHVYYNEDYVGNNDTDETSSSCRLVDELKINKHKFSELKRVIGSYVEKECDVHYPSGADKNDDTIIASSSPKRRRPSADTADNENEAIPVH